MAKTFQERLLDTFSYDPETGQFGWKFPQRHGPARKAKTVYYQAFHFEGKRYRVHRLIWIMLFGDIPKGRHIDHINGDIHDNRLCNLRLALTCENSRNSRPRRGKQIPYKGVTRHENKFDARIVKDWKMVRLGRFDTPEEAARAYDEAAKELYGEFARTNASLGLLS